MKCPQCHIDLFDVTDEEQHAIEKASVALGAAAHEEHRWLGELLGRVARKMRGLQAQKAH